MLQIQVIKILILTAFATGLAVAWTPFLTHFLYKYKLWRKEARRKAIDNKPAPVFYKLHKERETRVPRIGGLLIWLTVVFVIFFFSFLASVSNDPWLDKLNFLSRSQTWLPLATLVAASLLGLGDDILQVIKRKKKNGSGITFTRRLLVVLLIGIVGACWFYFKLDWHTLNVPFLGEVEIGIFYVLLFVIVVLACWSGGTIDGLDGLAGGAFSIMFFAYSIIAYSQMRYDLAAFCAVLAGTILAFLWFNIPPARFYMGETGIIGLTATLAVVSFLTDSVLVLPIIGGLLVIESGSVILQLFWKKVFHRKLFLCAPLHHHLEAKGWAPEKITMRFWILGMVFAIIGVAVRLLS